MSNFVIIIICSKYCNEKFSTYCSSIYFIFWKTFEYFNFDKRLVVKYLNLCFGKLSKMLIFILLKILPNQIIF